MNFLISFSPTNFATVSAASAMARASSSDASGAISNLARTLPFTCTAIVTAVSTQSASSHSTHGSYASEVSWPSMRQHSSPRCGAKGDTISASRSAASRGGVSKAASLFARIMSAEMAVLNASASRSSVTLRIVLCSNAVVSASSAALWPNIQPGASIVGGTTDSIAAFVACSVDARTGEIRLQPGAAVTSLGSTTALKFVSTTKIDDASRGVYSHRLDDSWLVGGASNAGCRVFRSFEFDDADLADLSARLDPQTVAVDGPFVYPLVSTGERFPVDDPNRQPLTREAAAEAVSRRRRRQWSSSPDENADAPRLALLGELLVGIAEVERSGYEALRALGAQPALATVATAGGGSKNEQWRAIRERMLGVPVVEAAHTDAAFGAAVLALRGAGEDSREGGARRLPSL
mmetsp:Transcript_24515/g.97265  ORF Transcript_24515/g.97265 Transcript_24515/m.97265 type:complete len:406 (+) Transcript_24515:444-1661(+)